MLDLLVKESVSQKRIEQILKDSWSKNQSTLIKPDITDLSRIHDIITTTKRTTILEFGVGYSSLVMADALMQNKHRYSDAIKSLRRHHPFELYSVDNEKKYIQIAKNRIPNALKSITHFHYSSVLMTTFNGRFATQYDSLPLINPDFIYLDGPAQFNVQNPINNFHTGHPDLMPMMCDILKFEHFLIPGTIILVDGRGANARFLKTNFQRNWSYKYEYEYDQHIFILQERPLGKINKQLLDFYNS